MLVHGVGATFDDIHRQRALRVWPMAEFLGSNVTTRYFGDWIGPRIRVFACGESFAARRTTDRARGNGYKGVGRFLPLTEPTLFIDWYSWSILPIDLSATTKLFSFAKKKLFYPFI